MNIDGRASVIPESRTRITASSLIRWAGVPAMLAGIIFAGIQPIHPADNLSSVTTTAWAIITPLKTVMCLLFLVGLTGIYARQVNKASWLGLAGYFLFSLSWAVNLLYIFAEAFILPPLASESPEFVESFLYGVITGRATEVNLGMLPTIYALNGLLGYMLGGLLFGIATYRAGILSRWAGGLLAVAAALTPLAALLPHELQRLAGVPVGIAVAWLGYALLSDRRGQASEPVPGRVSHQLSQTAAK
ncbi:MAG: hypothetical protein M3437_16360 [Chloroflexota bacterium]|nr:hypothetical protein [Chloroflexota bacterium]MDQ5864820.1 hypothetical protein [Chloroflexota bacterium]